jgi:succinyl-diaminopimelate desuccinylase
MDSLLTKIKGSVDKNRDEALSFLRDLIRIPSVSCNESEISEFSVVKMKEVGFNTVKTDELFNAMGVLKGASKGKNLLINGHLDHVPVGNMVDPYSGKILNGSRFGVEGEVMYGRAASDMKAAVAAMIMAGYVLNDVGVELQGDYKVSAVTQEETGGFGTISTIEKNNFVGDVIITGEATDMNISLGHRGTMKMGVVVKGRSCHASAPDRGLNAIYDSAELIRKIKTDLIPILPTNEIFGKTTIAVTRMDVNPNVGNVIPEECRLTIDCRNGPDYSAEKLKEDINHVIKSIKSENPSFDAYVLPYSIVRGQRKFTGFYTDPDVYSEVEQVTRYVKNVLERTPKSTTWKFATDGRFYSWLGIPVIGFGPGEERFAHTHEDHVKINDYLDAVKTYSWLACSICGVRNR